MRALTRKAPDCCRPPTPPVAARGLDAAVARPPDREPVQARLRVQAKQILVLRQPHRRQRAAEAGCKRLLTEDLQHGQKVGALRIETLRRLRAVFLPAGAKARPAPARVATLLQADRLTRSD